VRPEAQDVAPAESPGKEERISGFAQDLGMFGIWTWHAFARRECLSTHGGTEAFPMRLLLLTSVLTVASSGHAGVTVITDPQQWQDAVQSYTSVTFAGFPQHTHITDQYAHLGILFTDNNNLIHNSPSYPSDASGLSASQPAGFATIDMAFAQPIYVFAFDYIGGLQFELFHEGELQFTSGVYHADFGPFIGVISTKPFDAVIAHDWLDPTVSLDNIHFGPPIPAPGALALFGLALFLTGRRRRVTSLNTVPALRGSRAAALDRWPFPVRG
jgi:MYXO-CTERM domain-containing protein